MLFYVLFCFTGNYILLIIYGSIKTDSVEDMYKCMNTYWSKQRQIDMLTKSTFYCPLLVSGFLHFQLLLKFSRGIIFFLSRPITCGIDSKGYTSTSRKHTCSLFIYVNKEENLSSHSLIRDRSLILRNFTLRVPLYVVEVEIWN